MSSQMRSVMVAGCVAGVALALCLPSCGCGGGGGAAAAPPPPPAGGAPVPADPAGGAKKGYTVIAVANGGKITGTVTWGGATAPTPKPLDAPKAHMDGPKVCDHKDQVEQDLFVDASSKGVANVVVFIKKIAEGKALGDGQTLDNKGCVFTPHVVLQPAGNATLTVKNSDPVNHNTNLKAKKNETINPVINPGGTILYGGAAQKVRPEGPVEVTCDLHAWMKSWVFFIEHPYYVLTDAKGAFSLTDVPAGTYELVAWHGKSNAQVGGKSVTVTAGGAHTADLTMAESGTLSWK